MTDKVKTVIECYFMLPDFKSRGHPKFRLTKESRTPQVSSSRGHRNRNFVEMSVRSKSSAELGQGFIMTYQKFVDSKLMRLTACHDCVNFSPVNFFACHHCKTL